MRIDGPLYDWREEKKYFVEAMCLEAPKSMMKEEDLEVIGTNAFHLSLF